MKITTKFNPLDECWMINPKTFKAEQYKVVRVEVEVNKRYESDSLLIKIQYGLWSLDNAAEILNGIKETALFKTKKALLDSL